MEKHLLQVAGVPVEYAEGAFIGGLFHDIGKLLIAIALVDQYENIIRMTEALQPDDVRTAEDCETEFLGVNHCELSAAAVENWKLPNPIRLAVLHHHQPNSAPKELAGGTPLRHRFRSQERAERCRSGVRFRVGCDYIRDGTINFTIARQQLLQAIQFLSCT